MQAMLMAFISTNTKNSGIPTLKANSIMRTFPPLFTFKLPEEEKVMEELKEIKSMQIIVQVIMIMISILISIIVMYYFKCCFPFLPISRILRTSCRMDLSVEVNNITKGNMVWAHFTMTGYYPTSIHLSRPILKENVRIDTHCCIFKHMIVDWTCLLYTSPSPRDATLSRMPSSA